MNTFLNPDAIQDGSITLEKLSEEVSNNLDVFITRFSINDLKGFISNNSGYFTVDKSEAIGLQNAIMANKRILVPQEWDSSYYGGFVASGFMEDLIYLHIDAYNGETYEVECQTGDSVVDGEAATVYVSYSVVQPDWLATPGNPNFIYNRTHYYNAIMDHGTYDITHTQAGEVFARGLTAGNILHIRQAFSQSTESIEVEIAVGTRFALPANGPSIYAIFAEDENGINLCQDSSGYGIPCSIAMEEFMVGKQLHERFIPDTIARTNNLKTINGESILGEGNLVIENGGAKVQTVSLPTASGNITKDVYDAMFVADVVKFIYNNGQYELTMSSKERSVIENERKIIYSTIFFSVSNEGSVFKLFSVSFNAPSSSANAVSYQVTLANLAIGAATVSE